MKLDFRTSHLKYNTRDDTDFHRNHRFRTPRASHAKRLKRSNQAEKPSDVGAI